MEETLFEITYDGKPLVTVARDGKYIVSSSGCNHARIAATLVDVESVKLKTELTRLNQVATAALCNPYRDALGKAKEVWAAIPRAQRYGVTKRDVQSVLDAVVLVAAREVH